MSNKKLVTKIVIFISISLIVSSSVNLIQGFSLDGEISTFLGNVRNQNGGLLNNAKIELLENLVPVVTDYTETDGLYIIYYETSTSYTYKLRATYEGIVQTKSVSNLPGLYVNDFIFNILPTFQTIFKLYVYDDQATTDPVVGADAYLKTGSIILQQGTTDSNGFYEFDPVYNTYDKTYTILAKHDIYSDVSTLVTTGTSASTQEITLYADRIVKYAVIVGIQSYPKTTDLPSPGPEWDGYHLYYHLDSVLNFDYIWMYGDGNIYTPVVPSIYDPAWWESSTATEATVSNKVVEVCSLADENDIIMFFFNGHGGKRASDNMFLKMYDLAALGGRYNDDELADDFDDVACENIFVFLQCCYSGGARNDFANLDNSDNVLFIAACQQDEKSGCSSDGGIWFIPFLATWSNNPTWSIEEVYTVTFASVPYNYGGVDWQWKDSDDKLYISEPLMYDGDGILNNFEIPY